MRLSSTVTSRSRVSGARPCSGRGRFVSEARPRWEAAQDITRRLPWWRNSVVRHGRDLDGGDLWQLSDASVEFMGEVHVGGARVVVHAQRNGQLPGDVLVQSEHLVLGERLIRHRGQQHRRRACLLGILGQREYLRGPQRVDADDDGGLFGGLDGDPRRPGALLAGEVGVASGGAS
ncbi:hypothetical protein SBI_09622 [Streptomyces bingchenggensis BCW-1]|uniref:Uncharacterized protein n=1 Tax=Streptomyces bingchenggensis (strain BCW-1) TaxID=749414 RepID=D7C9M8_STRBB|nr:hypothetical protein SBI_09622 [Streptomyces bingchenggensis BCW-1]